MARPLAFQLRRDLADVLQHLEVSRAGEATWRGQPVPRDAPWPEENPWFEIWDAEGVLVRRFWPFSENRVQTPFPPVRDRELLTVYYPTPSAPDLQLRVLSAPYTAAGVGDGWAIRVLRIHEPVAESLGALRLIIFIALPVVVVQHRHRDSGHMMSTLLQESTPLCVCEVEDKSPIQRGNVYIAPADYHLLIDGRQLALSLDAPVRYSRPSIDVTFEGAVDGDKIGGTCRTQFGNFQFSGDRA